MPAVAAHVLHLDRAPVAGALRTLGQQVAAPVETAHGTRARVILGLDPCALCNGERRCPDCGGPCEVCTLRAGGTGLVR